MTRFDFEIVANALSGEDPHFSWDTHWVGNFDFVDYVYGRLSFEADYQAILGENSVPSIPTRATITFRPRRRIGAERTTSNPHFHHVSRHPGDRPKREPVAMNAWIVRMLKRIERRGATIDVVGNIGPVVARAWVDYTWLGNVDVIVRRPITPDVGFPSVHGFGETYGVDADAGGARAAVGDPHRERRAARR